MPVAEIERKRTQPIGPEWKPYLSKMCPKTREYMKEMIRGGMELGRGVLGIESNLNRIAEISQSDDILGKGYAFTLSTINLGNLNLLTDEGTIEAIKNHNIDLSAVVLNVGSENYGAARLALQPTL